jgi:malonyl-CoA/methylmalonyl-CoA synthetase
MTNANLYELLQSRFPVDPGRTAMEMPDGSRCSYGDLEAQAGRYARFLSDLGAQKGDRVAVQVDKTPQAVALYLACLRAGLIYLPLNTAYREDEIDHFLSDAEPAIVVCSPHRAPIMEKLAERYGIRHVHTLDAAGKGSLTDGSCNCAPEFAPVYCEPDDVAALVYTSGTTGHPKGAKLTHRNLASNALTLHKTWGWVPSDVLLHALPIFHVHGLFIATHCALLNGSPMYFLPRFEVHDVMRYLPKSRVMMGVPTFYTRLLAESSFGRETCGDMRLFISGSAPLLAQTFEAFRARTGHTILERYGMTETGMNTSNPLAGERIAGSVGFPLPGVSVRVVNDAGEDLATEAVGNLQVKGDNVFKGYWRLPDKTAQEFTEDGYFKTGDLAKIDQRGYVSIVGRVKDLIISGGYNIYPKEVELRIDDLEGVVESAVVGLPDADFGEAVTGIVVREPGASHLTESLVIDRLKRSLANYKVPKRVFFVESLPRNAMGKVQKNALRLSYAGAYDI